VRRCECDIIGCLPLLFRPRDHTIELDHRAGLPAGPGLPLVIRREIAGSVSKRSRCGRHASTHAISSLVFSFLVSVGLPTDDELLRSVSTSLCTHSLTSAAAIVPRFQIVLHILYPQVFAYFQIPTTRLMFIDVLGRVSDGLCPTRRLPPTPRAAFPLLAPPLLACVPAGSFHRHLEPPFHHYRCHCGPLTHQEASTDT